MTQITDARNAAYANPANTAIACEALFSDSMGMWLPFTVSADHPEHYGRQLFTDLRAGAYGEIRAFVVTPEMLTQAKQQKHEEINEWRDNQENGRITFTLNGHQWDCGKLSQQRLEPVINMLNAGEDLPDGFFWTDASNTDVALTREQLLQLNDAMHQQMVIHGFKIHERQRQMKRDIDQLTDISQVNNYVPAWTDVVSSEPEPDSTQADPAAAPQSGEPVQTGTPAAPENTDTTDTTDTTEADNAD